MNIRHAIACLLLFSSVSALPPVFPTRAHAQENAAAQDAERTKIRAKQMFEQGVSEYEAGEYTDALASFLEAYRLKPHPMVRVNIANCYDKLDKPVEAIFHFELFLSSKVGSPEQRDEINARHTNERAVAGLRLAENVSATSDLREAVRCRFGRDSTDRPPWPTSRARQIAVGPGFPPLVHELPADDVRLPLRAEHPQIVVPEHVRRHDAAQTRQVMSFEHRRRIHHRRGPHLRRLWKVSCPGN